MKDEPVRPGGLVHPASASVSAISTRAAGHPKSPVDERQRCQPAATGFDEEQAVSRKIDMSREIAGIGQDLFNGGEAD